MKQSSRVALSVFLVGILGAAVCGADTAAEARAEARQAVSDLVGELQRREADVVKARAAEEALAVQVESLREALAEATGKGVSGATATRELAARTAAEHELVQLRKRVAELTAERDAAVAESTRIKSQMGQELAERTAALEQREDDLRTLIVANRKDRVTLSYNLGCLYKASKKYEKAEEEFKKALALDPDDAEIHYNLGVLYDDCLKQPTRARTHYGRFLELSPNDADAARVVEWLSQIQ